MVHHFQWWSFSWGLVRLDQETSTRRSRPPAGARSGGLTSISFSSQVAPREPSPLSQWPDSYINWSDLIELLLDTVQWNRISLQVMIRKYLGVGNNYLLPQLAHLFLPKKMMCCIGHSPWSSCLLYTSIKCKERCVFIIRKFDYFYHWSRWDWITESSERSFTMRIHQATECNFYKNSPPHKVPWFPSFLVDNTRVNPKLRRFSATRSTPRAQSARSSKPTNRWNKSRRLWPGNHITLHQPCLTLRHDTFQHQIALQLESAQQATQYAHGSRPGN